MTKENDPQQQIPVGEGEGQYPPTIPAATPSPVTPPAPGTQEMFYVGTYKTKEEAEKGIGEKDATISRLNNQVSEHGKRLEGLQKVVDSFIAGTPQPGYTPHPTPPSPGYTPGWSPPAAPAQPPTQLPEMRFRDPIDDADGFRQDLGNYLGEAMKIAGNQGAAQVMQYIQGIQQEGTRREAIWEYFKAVNPDLSEDGTLVASTWTRLYGGQIPQNVAGMVSHVASEARNEKARIRGDQPPSTTPPPVPGRTDGIPLSAAPPTPPAPTPTPQPSTLTSELKELQKKSGFL